MTVDPGAWLDLARIGARRAGCPFDELDDAIGTVALDFVKRAPASEGEAVNRAHLRTIDHMRKSLGNPRSVVGRARMESFAADDETIAQLAPGAVDACLELVEVDDLLTCAQLPHDQLVALLAFTAGFSDEEIADELGVSTQTVRTRRARARDRLRSLAA